MQTTSIKPIIVKLLWFKTRSKVQKVYISDLWFGESSNYNVVAGEPDQFNCGHMFQKLSENFI